jgi:hypothetical protein
VLGLVAAGVGVVGVGVGSVFGLISKSKHDDANAYCNGNACLDERGPALKDEAIAAGNLSTVAFAVGAAGLAGGAVLWFAGKPESSRAQALEMGIGHNRLLLKGNW